MLELIFAIFYKEYKEQRRKTISIIVLFVILSAWIFNVIVLIQGLKQFNDKRILQLITNHLVTHQTLSFYFIICFIFSVSIFYKEKISKTYEVLFVTPLTPITVWIGKSIFIYTISLFFSYIGVFFALIIIYLFMFPTVHFVIPSFPSIIFLLIIFPLLSLLFTLFYGLIAILSKESSLSNLLFFLIGICYMALSSSNIINSITWSLLVPYFIVILVLFFVVIFSSKYLTPERIVLIKK